MTVENNESKFQFIVPADQSKIRLDKYLSQRLERVSRTKLQKLIDEEKVTVDGKPIKASHLVLPDEFIEVTLPKPKPIDISPENIPLNIIYEDENLIVVNKEVGMVVHPAFGNMRRTLVNALLYHGNKLSVIGGSRRPGIVHRLDKDTSGLLVVAKDDYTHQQLAAQFSNRTIEREYHAVVWGHFQHTSGRIESPIARSIRDRRKMVLHPRGKVAITNYRVIEQYPLSSLLSLRLETGRTHQIRVHLSSKGHPVLGDKTYSSQPRLLNSLNQKKQKLAMELFQLMPRQALHAKTLGFLHPITNEFLRFDSELPQDMKNLLSYLATCEHKTVIQNFS